MARMLLACSGEGLVAAQAASALATGLASAIAAAGQAAEVLCGCAAVRLRVRLPVRCFALNWLPLQVSVCLFHGLTAAARQ